MNTSKVKILDATTGNFYTDKNGDDLLFKNWMEADEWCEMNPLNGAVKFIDVFIKEEES